MVGALDDSFMATVHFKKGAGGLPTIYFRNKWKISEATYSLWIAFDSLGEGPRREGVQSILLDPHGFFPGFHDELPMRSVLFPWQKSSGLCFDEASPCSVIVRTYSRSSLKG